MRKPMTGRAWAKWSCGVLLAAVGLPAQAAPDAAAALSIVQKNNCLSCHAVDSQVVGPAYREIAKKYHGDTTAPDKLFAKVRNGGAFVWGEVPMPATHSISDAALRTVIAWIQVGVANTVVRRHGDFSPNERPAIADFREQLVGCRSVPVILLRDLSICRSDNLRIHGMTGETVVLLHDRQGSCTVRCRLCNLRRQHECR